ncbi:MAG: malonyl-CoA decarboxylase [Rhodocyclaceae bacterium]|nr:malonyl-CoA decarboxylase [Rhodocyclaceae bacterium]
MSDGAFARLRALVSARRARAEGLSSAESAKLRKQLRDCADGVGGEVSARSRALQLGHSYQQLDEHGKRAFLRMIGAEFGPDPRAVADAAAAYQQAQGTPRQWQAEGALRAAMRSARMRIFTHFTALPQGVKFLVDLRADLLRLAGEEPELAALDRELEARLSAWFDVGFLDLQRITWNAPAALLEKLIRYEAVHAIRSWTDLRNRLDSDRRCYAFFHPRMPQEPLIFVEVALVNRLADDVQALLDEQAPVFDATRADHAIFYSISNTQVGLRGVSFGNFLLKRVIDDLQREFPRLANFATLSPLPQLSSWLARAPTELVSAFTDSEWRRLQNAYPALDAAALAALLRTTEWTGDTRLARLLRSPLTRLAARYLMSTRPDGEALDPVARFHLGNGARIERLNPLADRSPKGLQQSFGMMVNYLYDPAEIEARVEAYARGNISATAAVRVAAKPAR